MASIMRMPELAANTPAATLVEWLVVEQSTVAVGDAIATVETDKATVDIEAEVAGVILKVAVAPGSDVKVGAPIAVIGAEGEDAEGLDLADDDEAVPDDTSSQEEAASTVSPSDNGNLGSELAERSAAPTKVTVDQPRPEDDRATTGRIFASPLARKISQNAGLQLAELHGTGPGGRIVRRDVSAALEQRKQLEAQRASSRSLAAADSPGVATAAKIAISTPSGSKDVPHTRLRRAIAGRLTESKQTAPHYYVRGTAKVDVLLELRAQMNEASSSRISVNDLVVKSVAKAHKAVPAMNVIWTPDAIRQFDSVDIAVAVATNDGLVTPVVRSVDSISLSTLSAATRDFAERARLGRLRPSDLEGGTVTVTNLGMYGTEDFSAIINPPHASILAVGAATESAVVEDGQLAVARTMRFTLSVDHRPVDGAVAAEWMREFLALIENPLRIVT
jgi:pyruvate dehydrogenase E2 component (dihydrolipoamide acetyltransferase)